MFLARNNFIDKNNENQLTSVFEQYISKIIKEKVEECLNDKGIFDAIDQIDKKSIENAIVEITPNMLCYVLEDFLRGNIYAAHDGLKNKAFEIARNTVGYAFNSSGIPHSLPYSADDVQNKIY